MAPEIPAGRTAALSFRCSRIDSPSPVRTKWLALSERTAPEFMLSWSWIGTWLEQLNQPAYLVEGLRNGNICLLGILVRRQECRHGFVRSRQLHLHTTGDPDMDEIWVEYNSFLALPDQRAELIPACIRYLETDARAVLGDWDELVIRNAGLMDQQYLASSGLHPRTLATDQCFAVDLSAIRAGGKTYLDSLSRNTRAQVRKSMRLYEERGPILMEHAQDPDEARRWFWDLAPMHAARWTEKLDCHRPAHQNPHFTGFHERLIETRWPAGEIELVRFSSGGSVIGYLYNFLQGGTVYFYLSALSYEENPRLKPGLVCHALCIQHHLGRGLDKYDFMAGNQRYKASLGAPSESFASLSLQRPRLSLLLERNLARLKGRLGRHKKQSQQP